MSSLIGIHSLSKFYGAKLLFEEVSFTLSSGDRVGLVGPNGAGKSTLFKIIIGEELPNSGTVSKRQGVKIGYASQSPDFSSKSLEDVLLEKYPDKNALELLTEARTLLSKAQFTDFSLDASLLSGGWKKRLDIARACMGSPDLLLLDEPTNHLDIEGILWLEKFLVKEKISYVVISHDRYFLEKISNKVIELNRCYPNGVFISEGGMRAFIQRKEEFLTAQESYQRGLASVVRDEVDWLRKSPKARTTKSRARIHQAHQLMEELKDVKTRNQKIEVSIDFSASERETKKLLVAKNLTKSLGGKTLFKNLDLTLSQSLRLGIVGKNGSGKTTLLKVLGGLIPQDAGTVKCADDLKLVYFDQNREQIPLSLSLRDALSPHGDYVNYRGRQIHVNGWAKKFLFSEDRLTLPVSSLSGGERARILIANLMLKPADILFLDEPTNDLDIPTLEVIEESLKEFTGAVVLISHDRCLMDKVCNQILGLGETASYNLFASYEQWESFLAAQKTKTTANLDKILPQQSPKPAVKKLSYKEQKELEGMEQAILTVELEVERIEGLLSSEEAGASPEKTLEFYRLLADAQHKLEMLFERWDQLNALQNSLK